MTERIVGILIVDDHQDVREGLLALVSTGLANIQIIGEASNGIEALRLAEQLRPDVVLMDLQMPQMDGVEATRKIRALDQRPAVLMLTTFADEPRIRDAIHAGAIGYLLKDVAKEDLLRAIAAAARGTPTLDPVAQQVLLKEVTQPTASPFAPLTSRERDVLVLISRGASNKEIAAQLFLSVGTVKGYVSAMLPKLGVQDRTQAALFAAKHGLH
jgi:NarL family two-component system response regulator LiaR